MDHNEQITRRAELMEAAAIESANQAMKALLLLNGGACIALLGFLASTFGQEGDRTVVMNIVGALRWFGAGAGLAVATSCVAYFVNSAYSRALQGSTRFAWRSGAHLNMVGAALAFLSLAAFWIGLLQIADIYL